MKFVKMLGLAVLFVTALMVFAGSASATILTSPAGTEYPTGSTVKSELKEGEAVFKSNFIGEVKCKKSTIEGKVETQGAEVTAIGKVATLTFTECNGVFTVLKTGLLEIHTEGEAANGNGTLTWSGTELTTELAGLHCIFTTSNTDIGKVTGGTPATFAAESADIPRSGGRSGALCGNSVLWNATYKVVAPSTLLVD